MINQQLIYEEIIERELDVQDFLQYAQTQSDLTVEKMDQNELRKIIKAYQ